MTGCTDQSVDAGSADSSPHTRIDRDRGIARARRFAFGALTALEIVLAVTVAGGLYWWRVLEARIGSLGTTTVQPARTSLRLAKSQPHEPFTILLAGADYRPGDRVYRTDVLMLAKIDPQARKAWLISIPRDARVVLPGRGVNKINHAHFYGGPQLTVDTVGALTGVEVNHYLEVNFRGFVEVVDSLGGVRVNVPVAIDDWKAASGSPRHRARHIDAGSQVLDGEHALTFARARQQFATQDFTRIRNQQMLCRALANQMSSRENLARLPMVLNRLSLFLKTDMTLTELNQIAQYLRSMSEDDLYTANLEGEWEAPYVYIDEVHMRGVIAKMKAGESFEDTTGPSAASE